MAAHTWGRGSRSVRKTVAGIAVRALLLLLVLVLATLTIGAIDAQAAGPPDVNGLYHGDDDYLSYMEYNTSEYGSKLYVYFDSPTVYVALVVDRSVNDNVFASKKDAGDYMESAGWNGKHTAGQLTNSEYAEFTLRCAEDPLSWTWLQGYGRLDSGVWVSDEEGSGDGTPPPSYDSSSSFAWNINTWNNTTSPTWDLHHHGTDIEKW